MSFLDKIGIKKSRDGRSKNPLYKHWKSMMQVAYRLENKIGVDVRWFNFWNFESDLKEMYNKNYKYFCRIDASKKWTLGNVWFTNSPKKAVFGRTTTHKVKINNVTMSTILLKKDLEEKGITISQSCIAERIRNGKVLTKENSHKSYLYNGEKKSLREISKIENIDYPTLKYWAKKVNLNEAIVKTKSNLHRQKFYEFDNKKYNQTEMAKHLAKITNNINFEGIRNKLKKGISPIDYLKEINYK